jgi:hypothetical protein
MNLAMWEETKWLPHNSYYPGLTATLNTKIGLSFDTLIGCCFLCDELTGLEAAV